MEQEQHRQPEEGAPRDASDERNQPPEAPDAEAITEREQRRALFERYVSLGINPEDVASAIEFDDRMTAARPTVAEQAVSSGNVPPSDETVPDQPRVLLTEPGDADGRHGIWLDAAVETEELEHAARPFLRHGDDGQLGYRIARASGFQGYDMPDGTSLETMARVARGIVEHGRAFVAFVDTWGSSQDAVDEFSRYFVGSYSSIAAWAETEVEAYGWWDILDEHVPPALLACLRVDFERLGRELSYDAHVVEDEAAGQVHVFRLHA